MDKYCVVVSNIKKIEVLIDAQSEEVAIEEVKKQIEKNSLLLNSKEPQTIYYIKY